MFFRNISTYTIICLLLIFAASFLPNKTLAASDILYGRYYNTYANIFDESRVCIQDVDLYDCSDLTSGSYGSWGMDASDFDNDGDVDIVAAQTQPFGVTRICLNNANNTFTCSSISGLQGYAYDIKAVDLDHDGDSDLLVSFSTQANRSCLNNGNAVFSCKEFGPTNQSSVSLESGDFNSDGNIDVAIARQNYSSNQQAGHNAICNGDGDGNFSCFDLTTETYYTEDVEVADFNGDSLLDVFFVNLPGSTTISHSLCLNNGEGNFNCNATGISVSQGSAFDLAATSNDFNNDGFIDVALAETYKTTVGSRICYNNGQGQFSCTFAFHFPIYLGRGIDSADIDENGYVDIVFTAALPNEKHPVCYNSISGFSCSYIDNDDTGYSTFVRIVDMRNVPGISNLAPSLATIGDKQVNEGNVLLFDTNATDTSSTTLVYTATNVPSGGSYNSETGEFSWTPGYGQAGTYAVTFMVSDGELTDSETIDIVVANTNRAPVLSPIGNQIANENSQLSFSVSATDADGDAIVLSANNLPSGATFSNGTFAWTPTFAQAGNYENIEFVATDNGTPLELAVELITITVGDVNRAPEVSNPGPQSVLEGQPVTFTVTASDPDTDTVTLAASGVPSGAAFNTVTGQFSWTPTNAQSGFYTVTVTATDNGSPVESGSVDIVITVGDDPTPVEQSQIIINTIVSFNLPNNVTNSYMANLQKVEPFITGGQIQPAINQLNAFINKVNSDYNQGKLTIAQRDQLVALAQQLLSDLQ